MKKYFIVALLFFLGSRLAIHYFYSAKFQAYADKTKAPWTCHVNNFIAGLAITSSEYDEALKFLEPVPKRCPNSPMEEVALYRIGSTYEKLARWGDAMQAYKDLLEKYPGSQHRRVVQKALSDLGLPAS